MLSIIVTHSPPPLLPCSWLPAWVSAQVQQVSTTVRTIIEGLAYLFSSVLSVVSLGLAALTLQLLVNPSFLREQQPGADEKEEEEKMMVKDD